MRLSDYAFDRWSQFGEDGMIAHIFRVIGQQSRFCVEFGAADGISCSNTKQMREVGWSALLMESDVELYKLLVKQSSDTVTCLNVHVSPENLTHFLTGRAVDFMSIDVDGDDYAIFEGLDNLPRVVCIEYNASVPPDVSVRQRSLGGGFGASARALCELAESKGYRLLEVTKGNLFFVRHEDDAFGHYERELDQLYDRSWLSYLATDYAGRPVIVGAEPPWGLVPEPFVEETEGDRTIPITVNTALLRRGFEARYGPATYFEPSTHNLAVEKPGEHQVSVLRRQMERPRLIMIDISHHRPAATFDWIEAVAQSVRWQCRIIPSGVIALIPPVSA